MLQRMNATSNSFINNTRMLQRTHMLQQTQILQRTRRNTLGRYFRRVHLTCRAFPLRFDRHSSSLLSFVKFSYTFSSFVCLFKSLAGKDFLCVSCVLDCLCFLLGKVCSYFSLRKPCLCFSNLHVHYIKLNKSILYYFYSYILYFILYFSCLSGCVGR